MKTVEAVTPEKVREEQNKTYQASLNDLIKRINKEAESMFRTNENEPMKIEISFDFIKGLFGAFSTNTQAEVAKKLQNDIKETYEEAGWKILYLHLTPTTTMEIKLKPEGNF